MPLSCGLGLEFRSLPAAVRRAKQESENPDEQIGEVDVRVGGFKGSYTFWYDYVSAYDETTGKETLAHTSRKVNFEGILVQGEEPKMDGFYLWDATGAYEDEKTGKPKTYKYKESFPVRLFTE